MTEFVVISQKGFKCPYCEKAVELLDKEGLRYSLRVLDRPELVEAASAAGMTTVPIIYHGDTLVGGCDDLFSYIKEAQ